MNGKPHYFLKLAILGEKQVGKTSLVTRFTQDSFSQHYLHTKGGDITERVLQVGKKVLHVTIIDSAGHKYVRSLIKTLYRDVHGIMLVYDVTRRSTFDALEKWMHEISLVNTSNPFILVVGNKTDLSGYTQVPPDEAYMYAQRHDLDHLECSAKNSLNVAEAFDKLLQSTLSDKIPTQPPRNVALENDTESKPQRACCGGS